jgi:hypothetical protein
MPIKMMAESRHEDFFNPNGFRGLTEFLKVAEFHHGGTAANLYIVDFFNQSTSDPPLSLD